MSTTIQITSGQVTQSGIEQMSFIELDATITDGLSLVHRNHSELLPFLAEMRERLHAQGKRTDLPDTPKGLTWQKWVENKKGVIPSLRTVNRLLAAPNGKKPKPVTQIKRDTTIIGEYNAADRSYCASAKVVEWSVDNKVVCRMSFEFPVENAKKKRVALAIEAFQRLRVRMKRLKLWHKELDVEMRKYLA